MDLCLGAEKVYNRLRRDGEIKKAQGCAIICPDGISPRRTDKIFTFLVLPSPSRSVVNRVTVRRWVRGRKAVDQETSNSEAAACISGSSWHETAGNSRRLTGVF